MTHPPLFFYSGAAWLTLCRDSFASLRVFNALSSLVVLVLLFLFCWRYLGRWVALMAAAFFAFSHTTIVFNRMVLPYNLYMLLAFLVFWLAVEYLKQPTVLYILSACVIAAFAALTVYYATWLTLFLLCVILLRRRWTHLLYCLIIPLPLILFIAIQVLSRTAGFQEDWLALKRAAAAGSLLTTLVHYKDFFEAGDYHLWSTVGLLTVSQTIIRWSAFSLVFLMLFPVMLKADTIIQFVSYPVIPVLPVLAIGFASFFRTIGRFLWRSRYISHGFTIAFVAALFCAFIIGQKTTAPLQFAMVKNLRNAYRAAEFVNRHTSSSDVVLASYNIWHLLTTARKADLPIALAYQGIESDFYRYRISVSRFAFDPSLDKAKFVILDFLTDQMAQAPPATIHYPVRQAVEQVRSRWRLALRAGEFQVYENPQFESLGQK